MTHGMARKGKKGKVEMSEILAREASRTGAPTGISVI
jgi:hypothetical protein